MSETRKSRTATENHVGKTRLADPWVYRAIIDDIILDVATANLDFKPEAAVKQTLDQLTQGRTTFIMAHRKSMLTEVDRVIALRDGRVVEGGPPPALVGQHGYFFQMTTVPRSQEPHVR